jgi:hypothetical protein
MDKATFNAIRRALHPDSQQSISDKKLGEAFRHLHGVGKYVLNEGSPTMPTPTAARHQETGEWDKKASRCQEAKRTSGRFGSSPTLRVAGRRERPGSRHQASTSVWVTRVDL